MPQRSAKPARPSFRPMMERLEGREVPATMYGLTATNQLIRFDSSTPGDIDATVSIQGLSATEAVVGIDFRPRTGQLYAVAVDGNNARLLTINPFDGQTRPVGTGFTLPALATGFGVDFNPTVDALRVVTTSGTNLRINPNTGAVTADTPLNPFGQRVSGVAYDRNFDGRLGTAGTTLYAINLNTGQLVTQGGVNQTPSPNSGTLIPVGSLRVAFDGAGSVAFDIPARGAAGGTGFVTLDADPTGATDTGLYTIDLGTGAATRVGDIGDGTTTVLGLAAVPASWFAAGGTTGVVEVREAVSGDRLRTLTPYPGFGGEIRVAVADVNRDGVPDVITGAGADGASHVKVFDGTNGAELHSFFAYDVGYTGGVFVAGGDINGDGYADVITGADVSGAPHVRGFNGQTGAEIASFFAYGTGYTGGVRVAAADMNNDGTDEIVTAAGATGAPHVKVFNALTAGEQLSFFAYGSGFTGGVFVAAGDVNGDGIPDIVTGAGPGGGPHVRAFHGQTGAEVASFFAYPSDFTNGVRVGVADRSADGRFEVLTAAGPGRGVAVRAFDAPTGELFDELSTVLSGTAGAFVAGMRV